MVILISIASFLSAYSTVPSVFSSIQSCYLYGIPLRRPLTGSTPARRGLLQIKMAEGCKLQICYLLHHLYDIQLRHRVESIVAFR